MDLTCVVRAAQEPEIPHSAWGQGISFLSKLRNKSLANFWASLEHCNTLR